MAWRVSGRVTRPTPLTAGGRSFTADGFVPVFNNKEDACNFAAAVACDFAGEAPEIVEVRTYVARELPASWWSRAWARLTSLR